MNISKTFGIFFFIVSLTMCHSVLAKSTNHSYNKPSIQSADDFYKSNVNKRIITNLLSLS